mmetsp:Transcript_4067/g.11558  ORF Transcript_4067/g.11558 Transcript_4067/m.11558 type:complete len:345 (-) Transcript_4067:183-1217(-)
MATPPHATSTAAVDLEGGGVGQAVPAPTPGVAGGRWAVRLLVSSGLVGACSLLLLLCLLGPDALSQQPPQGVAAAGLGGGRRVLADEPGGSSSIALDVLLPLLVFGLLLVCQLVAYKRSRGEPHELDEGLQMERPGTDVYGSNLTLTQFFHAIEFCGVEAKNRYMSEDGGVYIDERSDCFQRTIASVNRELTLFVHAGPNGTAPVVLRLYKPYHLPGCCCCRPSLEVDLPDGTKIGSIGDPFKCCVMNQEIFDSHGEPVFEVTGNVCQTGACCPCCADVEFEVLDGSGNSVGRITKKALTCAEACAKTNRFTVDFPRQCTMEGKHLLVGSAMLLDLQYFEQNKN